MESLGIPEEALRNPQGDTKEYYGFLRKYSGKLKIYRTVFSRVLFERELVGNCGSVGILCSLRTL